MNIQLLEITDSGLAYMVIGGFVVAFSMVSLLVKEKLYINEVVLGTAFGVIFGPYCANIFNPRSWGDDTNTITLEVMRVTLAAGLFAIGVELPKAYLAEHVKSLLVMVVPTMAFGWVIVAGIIVALFPSLNFISALVIAACLTPTDPIICAAIVGGKFAVKHVPLNLRRILSAESAANDGLAYPFLSISIYLTIERSRGVAIEEWFLVGWLYQVILGTVIGAVLGLAFSHLMKFSHKKGFIDRESYVAQYLALALFTIGVTRTLGSDDLLAAFAAGSAISWDGHFNTQIEDEVFSSVIDLLLNCGTFVYIGAWMPFNMFNAPELGITPWRLVVLFIAVLFLRRIPSMLLLYKWVPEISTWKEALFSGHFGPMGVGAIFVSTLAVTELPTPQSPPQGQAEILAATLQTIVAFVVLGSIIIHGLSIPFFSFGRNVRSRTLSLSRTLTARNANGPDWLLWARRSPAETARSSVADGRAPDVERGMDHVESSGLTEPVVISQDEAEKGEKRAHHVPELGPAAMIGDETANPELDRKHGGTQQEASFHDDVGHTQQEPETQIYEKPVNAEEAAVNVKHNGLESRIPSETPTRVHSPNASRVRIVSGSTSPSDADDIGDGSRALPSGAQTPASVSASHRSVRFPAADELATILAANRDKHKDSDADAHKERGRVTPLSGLGSGPQTPTSAKAVRFPDSLTGSQEEMDMGSPGGHADDIEMAPVSAGDSSGGHPLGKNVHFPTAQ